MDFTEILNGSTTQEPQVGYPKLMVLSGPPGTGKSTLSSGLNKNGRKCLVIDMQGGLSHVGGHIFDINLYKDEFKTTPWGALQSLIRQLNNLKRGIKVTKVDGKEVEEKVEPFQWDFIFFDPLSYLQPILTERAAQIYNNSLTGTAKTKQLAELKFGKNYTPAQLASCKSKDPVGDPDNSAGQNGWSFMKTAWNDIFFALTALPKECFIFVAHNKYNKLTKVLGSEIDVKALDFWPTYAQFLIAAASDSGAVMREGNKVYISFETSADTEIFKSWNFDSQKILISEKIGDKIEFYWENIFPFLKENGG